MDERDEAGDDEWDPETGPAPWWRRWLSGMRFDLGLRHGLEDGALGLAPCRLSGLVDRRGPEYAEGYLAGYRSVQPGWDGRSKRYVPR